MEPKGVYIHAFSVSESSQGASFMMVMYAVSHSFLTSCTTLARLFAQNTTVLMKF